MGKEPTLLTPFNFLKWIFHTSFKRIFVFLLIKYILVKIGDSDNYPFRLSTMIFISLICTRVQVHIHLRIKVLLHSSWVPCILIFTKVRTVFLPCVFSSCCVKHSKTITFNITSELAHRSRLDFSFLLNGFHDGPGMVISRSSFMWKFWVNTETTGKVAVKASVCILCSVL